MTTWPEVPDGEGEIPSYGVVRVFCQRCGKEIPSPSSFRTMENLRSYMVTGRCQGCQDAEELEKLFNQGFFKDA